MILPNAPHSITPLLHRQHVDSLSFEKLNIYTRYRGHPEFNALDHIQLLQNDLRTAIGSGGKCFAILEGQTVQAICAVTPLTWDSQHFGMPMAKLHIATSPLCPSVAIRKLTEKTINATTHSEPTHISAEVDIDDYLCLNTLLSIGGEILDIKREYRARTIQNTIAPKFLSKVRPYCNDDRQAILQIMETANFASRFSRDPLIPANKSKKMYQEWIGKILDRSQEERIALVIEKAGVIQACGTIEELDLRKIGVNVKLMSGGIYVSGTNAIGYYYPIIYKLIDEALKRTTSAQTCVSLNNHSAVRVLEKMNFGTPSTRYAIRISK